MSSNDATDVSCDAGTRRSRATRGSGKRGRGRKKSTPTTRSTRSKRTVLTADVVDSDDAQDDVPEELEASHDADDDPPSTDGKEDDDLAEAVSEDGDKVLFSLAEGSATENGVEDGKLQAEIQEEFVEEEMVLRLEEEESPADEEEEDVEEESKLDPRGAESVECASREEFGESSVDSNQVRQEESSEELGREEESSSQGIEKEVADLEDSGGPSPTQSDVQDKTVEAETEEGSRGFSPDEAEEAEVQHSGQEEGNDDNETGSSQVREGCSDSEDKDVQEAEADEGEAEDKFSFTHEDISNAEGTVETSENAEATCETNENVEGTVETSENAEVTSEAYENAEGTAETHEAADKAVETSEKVEERAETNVEAEGTAEGAVETDKNASGTTETSAVKGSRDNSVKMETEDGVSKVVEQNENDSKSENKQVREESESLFQTEPDTEMVSEDELPAESSKEPLETEAVSDEELPDTAVPVDLPETEAVSEDELPPEKTEKKKKKSKSGESENSSESGVNKKKSRSDSSKRKLSEGDTYDPSSPTSENSCDESPAAKRAAVSSGGSTPQAKPVPKARKALPELEKYWKAVTEDPSDFTGWTYLLQYVDQENDIEAAREAYDAFLSHYPYCYGYWRKYADYEKRKGNKEKCEDVFERGLKAIPLSVDLWIHYLNYCKATYSDDEDHLRCQFEKAVNACGMEFRSDRLWESYIKWETEGKRLQNVTALYDRLLNIPTQGYTNHFENFQAHISNNPPQKVLSVDEFLTLRREVLQLLKQYDQTATTDDSAPGEDVEVPPGEESEEQPAMKSDEETTALRERIVAIRRKMHKSTVSAVAERWRFEEGIKRPYFHVKPLERCQLKNWKEYLDFEIEQGNKDRIVILFERCLIACALYEEFWVKFIRYLESVGEGMSEKIRNVYERACTIHHTKKPNLHLQWAVFEESHHNYDKASEILCNLEKLVPNMLQVAYRRINLERRRNNLEKVCTLYEHYISSSKNKVIANNMAIKYARFCWKIKGDIEKAISILNKAVEKDKENPRLYLQLIDMGLQKSPLDEKEILFVINQFLSRDADPEQKVLFAQRKVEFMEDFGSDVLSVQEAHDEFQKYLKMAKDRKKKSPDIDGKMGDGLQSKKQKNHGSSGDSSQVHSSSQSPHSGTQPPQPPSGAQTATTAASQYPPPSYATSYTQPPPTQGSYPSGQYPPTGAQPPTTPYSQPPYNQQYSQSGDPSYANYQNWGYSQTGYGGYNQGWGNYNYYQ